MTVWCLSPTADVGRSRYPTARGGHAIKWPKDQKALLTCRCSAQAAWGRHVVLSPESTAKVKSSRVNQVKRVIELPTGTGIVELI